MARLSNNVTIILATILPSLFIMTLGAFALHRHLQRRRARYPNRGITPIGDEEIESWKIDKTKLMDEKPTDLPLFPTKSAHQCSKSIGSIHHKPPSLIIYQNQASLESRGSDEQLSPWSSSNAKMSVENLHTPVLARAPNSRPGLTDESIQGDEAFVTHPTKRHQPRASKFPSMSPRHLRTRSARSSFGDFARREHWASHSSPRPSLDNASAKSIKSAKSPRTGRRATVSTPARRRLSSSDDDERPLGLPPRLMLRSEIGRAIG